MVAGVPSHSVTVFHLNTKISNAKIKKYQLASQRGMGPATDRLETVMNNPAPHPTPPPSVQSDGMWTDPRPFKRARTDGFGNGVLDFSDSPGEGSSTGQRRNSWNIRYAENMLMSDKGIEPDSWQYLEPPPPPETLTRQPRNQQQPLRRTSLPPGPPPQDKETIISSARAEYNRNFMSYYIDGGDEAPAEDDPIPETSKPEPAPAPLPAPQPQAVRKRTTQSYDLPPHPPHQQVQYSDPRFRHHVPPGHQRPNMQPSYRQLPPAGVELINDTVCRLSGVNEKETLIQVIEKFVTLSRWLTEWGKLPAIPLSEIPEPLKKPKDPPPTAATKEKANPKSTAKKNKLAELDEFLATLDVDDGFDDSDDGNMAIDDGPDKDGLNTYFPKSSLGQSDDALVYGMRFIQHALKSWGEQSLSIEYREEYGKMLDKRAKALVQPQKRGPGRPRKFDADDHDTRGPPPPPLLRMLLSETREGKTAQAFQDVHDSRALRVNAILPIALTRVYRHVYKQVDQLINSPKPNDAHWKPVSYSAQIQAHQAYRSRVLADAARMEEQESARQQHWSQQQTFRQTGMPVQHPHGSGEFTQEQIAKAHTQAMDIERRRSFKQGTKQLQHQQTVNSSMVLPSQSPITPVGTTQSTSGGNAGFREGSFRPTGSFSADAKKADLSLTKSSRSLLIRSGLEMNFSFPTANEQAKEVWGPQAFPAGQTGRNLPNRGPMSASPARVSSNNVAQAPQAPTVLGSNVPPTPEPIDATVRESRETDAVLGNNEDEQMDDVQAADEDEHKHIKNIKSNQGGHGDSDDTEDDEIIVVNGTKKPTDDDDKAIEVLGKKQADVDTHQQVEPQFSASADSSPRTASAIMKRRASSKSSPAVKKVAIEKNKNGIATQASRPSRGERSVSEATSTAS